ncbi:MAG TPA: DUF6056 family protein [Buttiauxella sp.]|nr:DUF6056 family protein [Buttiauxella sp.]
MKDIGIDKIVIGIIIFLVVLAPSLYIPMHSDDYSYYLMGLSPSAHTAHYLSWSGRIIADIISPLLLTSLPHFGYEIVNSVAFAMLVLFISSIPLSEKASGKFSFIARSTFVFVLYWIANPNLGQTSFWIVGSANYLWTNMFIAAYLTYLLRVITGKQCNSVALFVLAFLAGCSNENTAIVVVCVTIFMVFFESASKKVKITSISGVVIGAMLLISSPGNFNRLSLFKDWNEFGLIRKVLTHFYYRFPDAMSGYWQVYIVLIASIVVAAFAGTLRKNTIIYMTVFFVGALLANAAMAGSPVVPPRSMNGALCFLLISTSFVLVDALRACGKFERGMVAASGFFCLFYFVPSYYLFNAAMHATYGQAKIRDSMMLKAKQNGISDVKVPDFYFPMLLKYNDRFELSNSKFMAKYYELKSAEAYRIGFDYSQINKAKHISTDLKFYNSYKLNNIYFYSETVGIRRTVILDFSGPLNTEMKDGDKIFMDVYINDNREIFKSVLDITPANVDGRFLVSKSTGKIDFEKISKINIGIYNTKTKHRDIEYSITR